MSRLLKLFPCAVLACAVSTAAQGQDYADMHKQLDIMGNIIKSSVASDSSRKGARVTGVDSTYLKGQGVVFTVNSTSMRGNHGSYNFNFVMPPLPEMPVLPEKAVVNIGSGDHEDLVEIETYVAEALESASESYERALDSLDNERDKYRELREQQRDLASEVRDIEREMRDLHYQLRRVDDESQKQLAKETAKLEAQKAKIEKQREIIRQRAEKFNEQQKAARQKQQAQRSDFYQQLSTGMAETLCLYGNGLKALPKNEKVTVILKAGGDKDGRRYKDKIYVYNKKDISACSSDKISVAKLLEKGQGYQF
ncbi:hypothetical protein SG34_022165 [Thalassomonas viridans]|uniref:Uncharacterized protein n=1 Tax=Thalassomonas viridans TaxID=137584 RepID=A0AAE9Z0Z7_9GAMM|nr:hypothetical protein [Thalassomonas viridans]WDE04044.1 hypothetical protein SG34_022165 [Thalassomonas viridans]